MRCMSCLEITPRREIRLCHGCKAWYCGECHADHKPCNCVSDLKSEDETNDVIDAAEMEQAVDDSKPGIWIVKVPDNVEYHFDFWKYVA